MSRFNARELRRRAKMLRELHAISDPEGRIATRIAWTRPLTALEKEIVPQLDALPSSPLRPAQGGRRGLCHHNCHQAVEDNPSLRVVLGWLRLFEGGTIPRCYALHSVLAWGGELYDPTPRMGGLDADPFVPDPKLVATWDVPPNGNLRVKFTRRGLEIPLSSLRTGDGILSANGCGPSLSVQKRSALSRNTERAAESRRKRFRAQRGSTAILPVATLDVGGRSAEIVQFRQR